MQTQGTEENQRDVEDGRHKPTLVHHRGILAKPKKQCQLIFGAAVESAGHRKFYNSLILNSTSQKAHDIRKKA
jgi:hypothetical protein